MKGGLFQFKWLRFAEPSEKFKGEERKVKRKGCYVWTSG